MNSVRQLSDRDFELKQRKNGNIITCNLSGISLVLFKSENCPHCVSMGPIMQQLSRKINTCNFAMINITRFPAVIKASQNSIMPITYVPFIVLYVNGKPFLKYDGDRNEQAVGTFVMSVINQLKTTKNFSDNTIIETDEIESVAGAIPYNLVCDKDSGVCYLTKKEMDSSAQPAPQPRSLQQQPTGRQVLNGALNPDVYYKRQNLNQYSGM